MPSLSNVLASIPGYGAYVAKRQMNEEQPLQEAQQVGALVGLQQKMRAQQQEQEFRKELTALGPTATQEQLAQVAAKYSSPADVMKTQQASLDRQAQQSVTRQAAEDRREAAKQMIDFRYDQLSQNAVDAEAKRKIEERRVAEKAEADRRHDETLRLIGALRVEAANKTPAGYRRTTEGNLEAIPGGPADQKLQGAFNQDTATLQNTSAAMDRLAVAANELTKHPGLSRITGISGAFPDIPGSSAADARAKLQTLKAQTGFAVLQDMRNASKTGGALGQITERELMFLQNALAALETAQSEAQIKESLGKIIKFTEESKGRLRDAFNLRHKDRVSDQPSGPPRITSDAEYDKLPSGTEFIDPDGKKRRKP